MWIFHFALPTWSFFFRTLWHDSEPWVLKMKRMVSKVWKTAWILYRKIKCVQTLLVVWRGVTCSGTRRRCLVNIFRAIQCYQDHLQSWYVLPSFNPHPFILSLTLSENWIFFFNISFDRYLSRTSRSPKVPWGRSLSYGGFGPIQLPKEYRPKQEPPTRVQKGHRHFGGGVLPFPR